MVKFVTVFHVVNLFFLPCPSSLRFNSITSSLFLSSCLLHFLPYLISCLRLLPLSLFNRFHRFLVCHVSCFLLSNLSPVYHLSSVRYDIVQLCGTLSHLDFLLFHGVCCCCFQKCKSVVPSVLVFLIFFSFFLSKLLSQQISFPVVFVCCALSFLSFMWFPNSAYVPLCVDNCCVLPLDFFKVFLTRLPVVVLPSACWFLPVALCLLPVCFCVSFCFCLGLFAAELLKPFDALSFCSSFSCQRIVLSCYRVARSAGHTTEKQTLSKKNRVPFSDPSRLHIADHNVSGG